MKVTIFSGWPSARGVLAHMNDPQRQLWAPLFPTLCSVTSCGWLEISHGAGIYTQILANTTNQKSPLHWRAIGRHLPGYSYPTPVPEQRGPDPAAGASDKPCLLWCPLLNLQGCPSCMWARASPRPACVLPFPFHGSSFLITPRTPNSTSSAPRRTQPGTELTVELA